MAMTVVSVFIVALLYSIPMQCKAPHSLRLERINNKDGAILKPLLVPRAPATRSHQIVQAHLTKQFQSLSWHPSPQSFIADTPLGPLPMTNLVFTADPTAPRRILLAAHYDTLIKSADGKENEFVGATDSALPCAMIVELCNALNERVKGSKKGVTLQAVFFDGEEAIKQWTATDSLYGSRELARLWSASNNGNNSTHVHNLRNLDLFILLDLLGAAAPRIPSFSRTASPHFQKLVQLESELTKQGIIHKDPSTRGISYFHYFEGVGDSIFILDDHVPFHRAGYRNILHLIPSPFPSVWHTQADDASVLDGSTIDDLAIILYHFLSDLF